MAIDLGDLVPLTVTITDASSTPTNASSVVLTVTLPDGTTLTPSVTNPAAGVYACDYPTTVAGRHLARWVSTGPQAAYTDAFDVSTSNPAYIVSLRDVKAQTNITNTTSDEELRPFVAAATRVIERHLKQAVARRTITEEVAANGLAVLTWNPVVALVSVQSVDGSVTWNVSTLHVTTAGVVTCVSGTRLTGRLNVSYIAGMSIIPEDYTSAALIIVQHLWETQRGASGTVRAGGLGDTLAMPRSGSSGIGYAIPNRALELLGSEMPGVA